MAQSGLFYHRERFNGKRPLMAFTIIQVLQGLASQIHPGRLTVKDTIEIKKGWSSVTVIVFQYKRYRRFSNCK